MHVNASQGAHLRQLARAVRDYRDAIHDVLQNPGSEPYVEGLEDARRLMFARLEAAIDAGALPEVNP